MLTDEEALRLIERVRRHTHQMGVVELCDWALTRVKPRWETALGPAVEAVAEVPKKDRKEYMRDYMAKRRKEGK